MESLKKDMDSKYDELTKNDELTQFPLENVISEIREFGKGPIKAIVVKLVSLEVRQKIFSAKNTLKGTKIFIDPDFTKLEYDIHSRI